jgi:hypothetical protein
LGSSYKFSILSATEFVATGANLRRAKPQKQQETPAEGRHFRALEVNLAIYRHQHLNSLHLWVP